MAKLVRRARSVRSAGLTGHRYLLAVAGLVALAVVPVLVAVVAGFAVLAEAPTPVVDPFHTYLPADRAGAEPSLPGSGVNDLSINDPGDTGWSPGGGSRMLW
jgi:hypothetical protein